MVQVMELPLVCVPFADQWVEEVVESYASVTVTVVPASS